MQDFHWALVGLVALVALVALMACGDAFAGGAVDLPAAKARVKSTGGKLGEDGWNLWSEGELGDWFEARRAGRITVTVRAAGQPARGEFPKAVFRAVPPQGRAFLEEDFNVDSEGDRDYTSEVDVPKGRFGVFVAFTNDAFDAATKEDRNLLVRSLRVTGARLADRIPSQIDWTDAAIRKLRMGTLEVLTRPGARVRVTQLLHEFEFGTAISRKMFRDGGNAEERRRYLEILAANFNAAVHENALKWYSTERNGPGNPDYGPADRMLEWCERHDIRMRGHCVYWGIDKYMQKWLKDLSDGELRRTLARRGREVTSRYRGRIPEYDLNNEMVHGNYYAKRLGAGVVADMFRWAKEGDPDARLYVDDYGIISGGGAGKYVKQIRGFLDAGIPVGGIGVQGHFGGKVNPGHVKRTLDKLAEFGLPIKVTEYDANTKDEGAKAEALENLYRVAFAHPTVEGILMWGFWEGAHWKPNAAPWKRDFTPSPAAEKYRELVFGEWWTTEEATADARGRCEVRAFFGRHRVEVDGKSIEVELERSEGRATVNVCGGDR
ncbi:MAG: endo-1,4-beta-xylanase [Planctomycetota bacterium]|jgi:GH35 family endo-1,4-beta-xylanase